MIGRGAGELVVVPGPHDTLQTLAARYLGDPALYWQIADANDIGGLSPEREVVVPLEPRNPTGVYENGYQVVPILNYHRFDRSGDRMAVRPDNFRRQLQHLAENDYRVVPLDHVLAFMRGTRVLPRRAVAITIDDGFQSTYEVAYPLLVEFGYPATVFVYSDFVGRGGMGYAQLREMEGSGLIDIQAHSKTHANLTEQLPGESQAAYRSRVEREIDEPAERLSRQIGDSIRHYAYPYGATNAYVMERLRHNGYDMGLTVARGPNPFFAHPYALRRSMVFSDRGMQGFVAALQTFEQVPLQ
ncbi:MAG: polysaccharide deacetylase family protein [Gammaproteobacteria bacterium]